jgi:hypothetical protein
MMYRDIAMTPAQSLTVSFNYRTRMSTSIGTTATTRTGWFHGDPLAVVAGNFISSSAAGANAPQDSFMVYVGAPVNDAACVYSDGVTRPVYDKQRRWFSEVIKAFGAGANYFEIFRATGNNPADTLAATPSSGPIVVPAATISSVLGGVAGNVRLVFRCKTNRGFADSDSRNSGYDSAGRGAVLLDDVTIDTGSGPSVIGNFETPEQGGVNAIDNRFPLPPGTASARTCGARPASRRGSTSTSRTWRTSRTTTSAVRRTRPPRGATSAAWCSRWGTTTTRGLGRLAVLRVPRDLRDVRVADDQPAGPGRGWRDAELDGHHHQHRERHRRRDPLVRHVRRHVQPELLRQLLGVRLAVLPGHDAERGQVLGADQFRRHHRVQPRAAVFHRLRAVRRQRNAIPDLELLR